MTFSESWLSEHQAKMTGIKEHPPRSLPDRIEIDVPKLAKLPNEMLGKHWSAATKEKKAWRDILAPLLIQFAHCIPMQCARVTITRFSTGATRPDYDNNVAAHKALIDLLLVRSKTHPHSHGIIEDDSPEHLKLWMLSERVAKRAEQRTHVLIERR